MHFYVHLHSYLVNHLNGNLALVLSILSMHCFPQFSYTMPYVTLYAHYPALEFDTKVVCLNTSVARKAAGFEGLNSAF